jgi:hypothetical protein
VGTIVSVQADDAFNHDKGEITVSQKANSVLISPRRLAPRAILRVNIDVRGVPDEQLTRAVHDLVPFRIQAYENACYTR